MAEGIRYGTKTVKALRGTENRSIAKWQGAGWELVDQNTATLHTTLTFRKPKPKVPWLAIAALCGVLAVLAAVGGIASLLQGDDEQDERAAGPTGAARAPSSQPSTTDASPSLRPRNEPPAPSSAPAEQVLTAANSPELAALLGVGDSCDTSVGAFADRYEGRTVQFDGSIAAFGTHEDRQTRYDILVAPGDAGVNSTRGPAFQFRDVGIVDLNLTGPETPETVGPDDLLGLTARVSEYDPASCLLLLDPVATRIR
jgi:hypothetical protein